MPSPTPGGGIPARLGWPSGRTKSTTQWAAFRGKAAHCGPSGRVRSDQAFAEGVGHRVRAVAELEPVGHVVQDALDGPLGVAELVRDFLCGQSTRDEAEHLGL